MDPNLDQKFICTGISIRKLANKVTHNDAENDLTWIFANCVLGLHKVPWVWLHNLDLVA